MTFDHYWQSLVDKTPQLANGENRLRISTHELKRHLRKAFEAGAAKEENPFPEIFERMRRWA